MTGSINTGSDLDERPSLEVETGDGGDSRIPLDDDVVQSDKPASKAEEENDNGEEEDASPTQGRRTGKRQAALNA